ncbi:MAG: hypothetical protein R3F56_11040 [Planctomycetota bacterium]
MAAPTEPRRWLTRFLAAALVAPSACSGFMQAPLPARAMSYARAAAADDLRVGAAEADITPDDLPYLAGFGLARRATAVASPLKARALVLVAGGARIAIVGIDSLGLLRHDVDWVKGGIAGFPLGNVFLCASHTHAAPDLIGLWGYYLLSSGRDPAYLARVRRGVAEAVAAALARAQPARLQRAEGRLPATGLVRNSNRRGVFDRALGVVHAVARADGAPLGTLLHMGCHPEVLSRRRSEVSADFVGALCDAWRAAGHGQAVFVNGALGAMVSPDVKDRDPAGAEAMGRALCSLAEDALAEAEPVTVDSVEVRRADLYVPLQSLGLLLGRQTVVIPRPTHAGWLRSTVGYLRLGDIEVVAVPGEMEPGLAERLRRRAGRPGLMVFGLVDDEVGYLMAERDARAPEFAYERSMSPSADVGERVLRALLDGDGADGGGSTTR